MNLEHLNYFVETAESGSVSRTAQKVHVSSSAVSQGIAGLEQELGIRLFHRTQRKLVLTKEGEGVLQEARGVLTGVERIRQLSREYTESPAAVMQIATVPGMTAALMDAVTEQARCFPNVTWELLELDMADILEKCRADEISMGFIAFSDMLTSNYRGIDAHRLVRSEIKIVVAADSPLEVHGELSLDELARLPVAVYKDSFNMSIVKQLQQTYGSVDVRLITNQLSALADMILTGAAVSFAPEHLIANNRYLLPERIAVLPIRGIAYPPTYLWAVHSNSRALSQLEASFLQAAQAAVCKTCSSE